jgi:hypothetical protein
MWKKLFVASLLIVLLSGCATAGRVKVVDLGCEWAKPIRIDPMGDQLTDDTAQQIEAHNEVGLLRCGWKPSATPNK